MIRHFYPIVLTVGVTSAMYPIMMMTIWVKERWQQ